MKEIKGPEPEVMVLKFADSKVPEFKEVRNKDFILYGKNNLYPEYLTYLYNKSAKHGAIINGKCNYIFGNGVKRQSDSSLPSPIWNRAGETQDDIIKKSIKDIEIYGGHRWFIVWDILGRVKDIFHIDFFKVRNGKEKGEFWYKEDWSDSKEEAVLYYEFNPDNPKGAQIFAYNEYRPGCGEYPLPGYLACNNYIETDIEISKYNLSAITNGMMPSKLIQIYTGGETVTDEKKKEREKKWNNKFTGSEAGGKVIMAWCASKDKNIEITDLSSTDSDKLFDLLNKTCQQEIFTGHGVVSPMLFGIKTEGQLGGSTELKIAHEIFINTYAKGKQGDLLKEINYFDKLKGGLGDFYFEQVDPIGYIIPDSLLESALKPEEVRERLGLPPLEVIEVGSAQKTINSLSSVSPLVATKILDNLTRNEIRSLANLPPLDGGDNIPDPVTGAAPAPEETMTVEGTPSVVVNDNIKNLSAKQHQQLMRIIRQYSKGQLTIEAATALLKAGLGLNDSDIASLLGVDQEAQAFAITEVEDNLILQLFADSGESKDEYHVIKSKPVKFESDEDASEDEMNFFSQAFATKDATQEILSLISKDKQITPEVIAEALKTTPEYVVKKLAELTQKGLISNKEIKIGEDVQVERALTKPLTEIVKDLGGDPPRTEILIKYSYEGPKDDRNRPFCKKMMELNRFYSRYEIELISQRLGYSVFDRRGGFWRKPDGTISASCRHVWRSAILVRKGGGKS